MALVPISLGVRSNPSRHAKQAGNARLINCFAEEIGEEGKTQWVITACAGLETFGVSMGTGAVRGALEVGNFLYVVAGQYLLKVDKAGNFETIGPIPTTGPVYMRRNRADPVQIGIVSDSYYAVCEDDVLTEISDPDLPAPAALAYLDGYGILPGVNTNGHYMITAIDDFTAIDGLDEGTAEADPDPIVVSHELGREVYHFGTKTTEAHQNTGDEDFPFTRSQVIDVGCAAKGSVWPVDTPNGKALMFIAHDHTVRLLMGYSTAIVSTGEIDDLIRQMAESRRLDEIEATSWSWGGRSFYELSSDTWTRVYDSKTGYWHERASYLQDRWNIGKVISFAGMLIAGDATTGQLYRMRDDLYDEAGQPIVMEIITPPVHMFPYGGIINALYPDIVSGVGLNTTAPQNLDPVATIDWSKDGGESWSSPREVKLHRLGQTGRRVQPLTRMGRFGSKGVIFRIRVSAAVKRIVLSMQADIEQLAVG
ncbi:conserved protein of unknown function [Hyphomicrobium sp. 1Nfss2.1]|uniref:hypothetical protein n=1 Tax=Hyphomicrobium sp. 1Nfss2.1 TaxID=3413936 RepID=UPI003C7DF9D7